MMERNKAGLTSELSGQKRALLLQWLEREAGAAGSTRIAHRPIGPDPIPPSFAQQRLFFLDRMNSGLPLYNIVLAWRIRGSLDQAALGRAWDEIVRRHEVLRTVFPLVHGEVVQQIIDAKAPLMQVMDLSAEPSDVCEAMAMDVIRQDSEQPFDLEQGPLLRVRLYRLGTEDQILCMAVHHIAFDGWSAKVVGRELSTLYAAYHQDTAADLPELPIQYADFAVWQREQVAVHMEEHVAYWKEKLQDAPTELALPLDWRRPAAPTFRGGSEVRRAPERIVQAAAALAASERTTPFTVYLAAFYALLFRYTGQEELVVGTPFANRTRAELEGLVGFFVNTLPLRAAVSGGESFRQLVNQIRQVTLEAQTHQSLPFDRLVDLVNPSRAVNRTPMYQAVFNYHIGEPGALLHLPGLETTVLEIRRPWSKFDLTLSVVETQRNLTLELEYDSDIFMPGSASRFLRHLVTLLEVAVAKPDTALADLPMLTEAERAHVLNEWSAVVAPCPLDRTVPELFEEQVCVRSDAVALVCGDRRLTYGELNRQANQLARYLRRLGVGPEVPVGLLMHRSLPAMVGLLGILKAGGAYVPMDPSYPTERIRFIVQDAGVTVLLTDEDIAAAEALPQGVTGVCLERHAAAIADESTDNIASGARPKSLVSVFYTSGSTGTPKGVAVEHRGVVRLVKGTDYVRFGPGEVFFQLASLSFDATTFEIWGALLNGSTLYVPPPHVPTLQELGGWLQESQATTLLLTTPLFNHMVDGNLVPVTRLRQVVVGGEALSPVHVRRALAAGCRISNAYGPTECTTIASCHAVNVVREEARSVPIGRPIPNTCAYVLDSQGQLLPAGVPGELHLGGPGVARGYLNQPALTASQFIPDPFSGEPGARLYRTGDLVRLLEDGTLDYLGRMDGQVKVRGFRIETGEIESFLAEYPRVREAVVVVREEAPGDKRLVAYLSTGGGVQIDAAELRSYLKTKLPEYMIPSAFVTLDAFPLSTSGKVDRRRLPAPRQQCEEGHVEPGTPVEEVVAAVWADVFGVEQVGVCDDFFDLGGHSLLIIRLVSRLTDLFEVPILIRTVFEAPTVRKLSTALQNSPDGPRVTACAERFLSGLG